MPSNCYILENYLNVMLKCLIPAGEEIDVDAEMGLFEDDADLKGFSSLFNDDT